MVRKGVGILGLLIAIGLAGEPAAAGSRKSSSQMESRPLLVSPAANTTANPSARPGSSSSVGLFETDYSGSVERSANEREKETHERKPLTLYRFNSRFGEVEVRPVIGKVNGAQFSLGF